MTRQIFTGGLEVTATATYDGSTSAGTTDVTLGSGQTVNVGWDGKAVGVIATVQRYWAIDGQRYYGGITFTDGAKGSQPSWLFPGDCYNVERGRLIPSWLRTDSEKVVLEVDSDKAYSISAAIKSEGFSVEAKPSTSNPTKYKLEVTIGRYYVYASETFKFTKGSKGWFTSSCDYSGASPSYKTAVLTAYLLGP